ncbi:MAG: hypothetical protein QOC81_5116 [Thermoanaerobaculia bacterium]|jgi:DNA-directed RNA polymerase subunit RPC12/RpoP|nr:hypothetical protein [Thermoanaerobaculia bacterium]
MDYPWWTIDAADYGLREEDEIHCLDCAERNGKALGRELTDSEIDEAGGVSCQACGRRWRPVPIRT